MKIANKISLSFLAAALVILSAAGTTVYIIVKNNLQKSIYNNLSVAAASRTNHIETYLEMLKISVGQLSKSTILENFLEIKDKEDSRYNEAFQQAIRRLKRTKEVNPSIFEFMLLDAAGKVAASSNENSIGADKSTDAYFLGGQKKTFIRDVYYSVILKELLMAVSAPLLDSRTGELLGVLVARVKLNDLNNIVTNKTGVGQTGEVYIVNKYGFMITPSRFIKDAVLKQKVDTQNVRMARLHKDIERTLSEEAKEAAIVFPDYRGVSVLGIHTSIPQMNWMVLVEINAKEAFAPLAELRRVFFLALFIAVSAAWLSGISIARFISKPIHKLHKGAEIIGSGNLDYRVGTDTKDEIGQLSRAFDAMTENLKNTTTSIENLNKEIAERKRAEVYREMSREVLQILNEPGNLKDSIQRVLTALKTRTGFDAVGIRLQDGDDFPYFAQEGFSNDFLLTENTLIERAADGGVCRDKDGNVRLECTCGLVVSGKTNPTSPLFTRGGSFWTNDSFPLLDIPLSEDPRLNPRNQCIHIGYASVALIPIRTKDKIVGLIHLNDRRKGCLSLDTVEYMEGIASHLGEALMRKQAENELRKLSRAVEQNPACIVITDAEGNIEYVNPKFVELTGYTSQEAIGKNPRFLKSGKTPPEEYKHLWDTIKSGREWHGEFCNRKKNGEFYFENASISPVINEAGVMTHFVAVKEDITDRKKAEKEMQEAIEMKTRFISTASHELRTPLTSIKEGVNLVYSEITGSLNNDQKEFLGIAKRNIDRLARLINDVLDFQKITAGKMDFNLKPASINETVRLVEEAMRPLTKEKGLDFIIELDDAVPFVDFDKDKIIQVLTNLVSNAVKFTETGSIKITTSRGDNNVIIAVKDSGGGIKQEDMHKLFVEFEQLATKDSDRKVGGTGLGLAISKKIVENHGGRIWVESDYEKGSTFYFELPMEKIPCQIES